MVPVFYDLHIHTALSPCANDDMTPNDIVGMAILNGLDLIAVTDHNAFSNVESVIKAAKAAQTRSGAELIVLPGIEVSTAEEVHVVCLFPDLETAYGFERDLEPYFSPLANRVDIFGHQFIYNENDNILGEVERMLIAPSIVTFDELYNLTKKHGGAFIPAHIDRDSFSVISNLGFLPPHLDINTIEVSIRGVENKFVETNINRYFDKKIIFSSDAHQLWSISERENSIMLPERSAKAAIDFLR